MDVSNGETSMDYSLRPKQPLRRLQNAINNCVKVAIPLHIELLNKHKSNIEKFQELQEWNKVHKEQINASRTVEQLKADIWSLDLLRSQIDDAGLQEFDKQIKKPQELVMSTLQQFVSINKEQPIDPSGLHRRNLQQSQCLEEQSESAMLVAHQIMDEKFLEIETEQMLRQDLEDARRTETSWNRLVKDCQELNESMVLLSSYVHQQEEPLNTITANIDMASENVSKGNAFLAKAVQYKAMVYPLSGALIGTCLAGPVGLVVGLKAGAVAGALGGVLGFTGGRLFKKKVQRTADLEMYKLEQQKCIDECSKRHSSMPELRFTEIENGIVCIEKIGP